MNSRNTLLLALSLALALAIAPIGAASAEEMPGPTMPPGIQMQAEPIMAAMMQHMQQMGMSPEEMQMMMADMQMLAEQLPPGVFLEMLKLMPRLSMEEMMALHTQLHQGDLLQQPPGLILSRVRAAAG